MSSRSAIPAAIRQQLRKEAFFGCGRCGHPFIEYHHILGVQQTGHVADEMMLLCPSCHHLATVGALDVPEQRRLKAMPYNRLKGYANGQLWTKRDVLLVDIGSNVLAGPGYKLVVDEKVLFAVRHGEHEDLLVSLAAYDEQNKLALLLEDNEWIMGADSVTDFVAKPQWLRLTSPHLPMPLVIDARDPFLVVRGSLRYAGRGWDIGNVILNASGTGYAFSGMGFFDSGFIFKSHDRSFMIGSYYEGGQCAIVALYPASTRAELARKTLAFYRKWKLEANTD